MEIETCRICGGDGRIGNAFGGSSTTCPGCNGTGRRSLDTVLIRDVTKTKPSHYRTAEQAATPVKATWPSTHEGTQLANDVKGSHLPDNVKEKLIREIIDYEGTHGRCTQTFSKKIRKQVRASAG